MWRISPQRSAMRTRGADSSATRVSGHDDCRFRFFELGSMRVDLRGVSCGCITFPGIDQEQHQIPALPYRLVLNPLTVQCGHVEVRDVAQASLEPCSHTPFGLLLSASWR